MGYKLTKIAFIIYQSIFASKNASCRYSPTCSRYALDAVHKYGLPKGSFMAIRRLLSCHPFSQKPIYDPA